jgi:hypothetical protein
MTRASALGMSHNVGVDVEVAMAEYSAAFNAWVVMRPVRRQAVIVSHLAEAVGVPQPTLSRWVLEPRSVPGMPRRPREELTRAGTRSVVQEATSLDGSALGPLPRRVGL